MAMFHHHSRTITLTGSLDRPAVLELIAYCRGLTLGGRRHVVVDLSAVLECDLEGLAGLERLRGRVADPGDRQRLPIRVSGAHWCQFVPALLAAPQDELDDVRARIERLISSGVEPVLARSRRRGGVPAARLSGSTAVRVERA